MESTIGAVINYCTNDYKFLRHNVRAVSKFAKEIIIPTADHFYDGTPENKHLLSKSIRENKEAKFIKFLYKHEKRDQNYIIWRLRRILKLSLNAGSQYWICLARLIGFKNLSSNIKYVLFLDADEIINSKKFTEWLDTGQYKKLDAMKLANYWYFREPKYQAATYEDTPLLARKSNINKEFFLNYSEREGIYQKISGRKKRMIFGLDNKPMVHHYGWVRSKKEMLKKVQSWGHNRDVNWTKLVTEEFTHKFNGRDFVQNYQYKTVKPYISFLKSDTTQ